MRSLLISFGGARYRSAPQLFHAAFEPSSRAVASLLTNSKYKIIEPSDHLDLFDDDRSWPDQLIEVRNWIKLLLEDSRGGTIPVPENILVHYVGHGWFLPNSKDHMLTINHTDATEKAATSAVLGQLNSMLLREASGLRRYYIIDACFAAASLRDVMTVGETIQQELGVIIGAWPEDESGKRGVAALCSADKDSLASARGEGGLTQFTDGVSTALNQGHGESGQRISLRKLYELLRVALRSKHGDSMVDPVLVAPNDRDGGIAGVPLFANAAQQHQQKKTKIASAVTNVIGIIKGVVVPSEEPRYDVSNRVPHSRATSSDDELPTPKEKSIPCMITPIEVTSGDRGERARALEIALSDDVSFRRLVYRFFKLPQSKKIFIVDKLGLRQADDDRMRELDRFKAALARARDNGKMKRLENLIDKAEGSQ